jgi:hypothetical protein
VVGEEGAPRLRGRTTATQEVLRPGRLRHLDADLLQLAVDAGCPQSGFASRIWQINARRSDASAGRPTAAGSRVPAPVGRERAPMPSNDGGWRHNLNRLPPAWPDAREQYPEEPFEWTEAWSPWGGPLQYSELMPKRENLRREVKPRADRASNRGQQGEEQRSHPARER